MRWCFALVAVYLSSVYCILAPEPESIEVIVNSSVLLSCTGVGDTILFLVNGKSVKDFEAEGFAQTANQDMLDESSKLIRRNLTLTSAKAYLNNTEILCLIEDLQLMESNKSDVLILQIQGTLDAVNILHYYVTLVSINATWSAPYTLDGVDILGYNITIENTSNGNILYVHFTQDTQFAINLTAGDPCTELKLTISGYNAAGNGDATSINFTYPGDISIQSVNYQSDGSTLQVTINVASLCPSEYPSHVIVRIGSTAYNVTVLPTNVMDGLLILAISEIYLMSNTTYNLVIMLNGINLAVLQTAFMPTPTNTVSPVTSTSTSAASAPTIVVSVTPSAVPIIPDDSISIYILVSSVTVVTMIVIVALLVIIIVQVCVPICWNVTCSRKVKIKNLHKAIQYRDVYTVKSLVKNDHIVNCPDDIYHQPPIHKAAKFGYDDILTILLDKKTANVDTTDREGNTALHRAVQKSDNETCIEKLISCGANVNIKNNRGNAPLHSAIEKHSKQAVKLLVRSDDIDLCVQDQAGHTPLNYAIKNSCEISIIRKVINTQCIDIPNKKGCTPLYKAVARNRIDVVQLLIDKGANTKLSDNTHETPLDRATTNDNTEMIQLLTPQDNYDAGCTTASPDLESSEFSLSSLPSLSSSNQISFQRKLSFMPENIDTLHLAVRHRNITAIHELINDGADIDAVDDVYHQTPLHIAAVYGYDDVIKLLVENGATVDSLDLKKRETPLFVATARNMESSIRTLIKLEANVNIANNIGFTPLHIAVEKRNLPLAKELIESRANLSAPDEKNRTPLSYAIKQGCDISFIEILVDNECVNIANDNGYTPLHKAVTNNDIDVVKLLLKHGAKVDTTSSDYHETPIQRAKINRNSEMEALLKDNLRRKANEVQNLHQAVMTNDINKVKKLIRNSAELNEEDKYGQTPLHRAVALGYIKIVDLLLAASKVTVDAVDKRGSTPLHVAIERKFLPISIIEKLVQSGAALTITDKYKRTPLCLAVIYEHTESTIELLCNNECIDIAEKHGHTPLLKAVINDDIKVVKLLMKHETEHTVPMQYAKTKEMRELLSHHSKALQPMKEPMNDAPDVPLFTVLEETTFDSV